MSKSKSKSKSKQATFPNEYWRPEFEIYTYYPTLFDHGRELLAVDLAQPPQHGDVIASEVRELLRKQQELNDHLEERERRWGEIEWELDHLARGYQTALLIGPDAYSKTWQLMNTMGELTLIPVMHFKKKFARARPTQIEPRIAPLIEVPGHPAYPSGHSTQNFVIAHLLSEVIGDDAELIARVFAIARRVAENREWAGVHYASDTQAGEELAREIYLTMRRALAEPIKEAIEEWQELELEERAERVPRDQPAAAYQLQDAPAQWRNPFSVSHFHRHQWNLQNREQTEGKPGVDINVFGAWQQLQVWEGAPAPQKPVRVALIDLAIDFDHPALVDRFDRDSAVNLDYPSVPKNNPSRYKDGFASFSSAHAIACAGIIAADRPELVWEAAKGKAAPAPEPGCLGIAPHSRIIPFRAMTLTEPVRHKRQLLARAVLQAATGHTFVENCEAAPNGPAAGWKIADRQEAPADLLLFPLPLEPLPEPRWDPLPLALAFAATRIPVIIPSGNKGTSSLTYPWGFDGKVLQLRSMERLADLLDLDPASARAIFVAPESNQQTAAESGQQPPKKSEHDVLDELLLSLGNGVGIINVGACNDLGQRSRYSQYGNGLTLVAPSDDVLASPQQAGNGTRRPPSIATTDLKGIGGYMQDQSHFTLSDNEFGFGGTSAAAAQIAGIVALMLQAGPTLCPKDVREILCNTARVSLLVVDDGSAPAQPSADFGYGLVDAARAVEEAKKRAPKPAAS